MFNFIPSAIPHNILVVGCGGTGSRLVPLLTQFMRSVTREYSPRGWLGTPNIVLCDFDVIEEKNLARQNFIRSDIGKNKAVVLAERYSKAYGLSITPMTDAISTHTQVSEFFSSKLNVNLMQEPLMIIMCVDSVPARRTIIGNGIHLVANGQRSENVIMIDSGNEDNFGQVNLFNPVSSIHVHDFDTSLKEKLPKMITHVENIVVMPMDAMYYLNMADNPGLGSCADLDQTLAINALVATNIMAIVQNYYYRKPMNYNRIFIDMAGGSSTTFNTLSHFMNTTSNTDEISKHPNMKEMYTNSRYLGRTMGDHVYVMADKIQKLEDAAKIKAERAAAKELERQKAKTLKGMVGAAVEATTATTKRPSRSKKDSGSIEETPRGPVIVTHDTVLEAGVEVMRAPPVASDAAQAAIIAMRALETSDGIPF